MGANSAATLAQVLVGLLIASILEARAVLGGITPDF